MLPPEASDFPILGVIGAIGSAVAIVVNAWRGKKEESEARKEPARTLVLDHADTADTRPVLEAVEGVRDAVMRIETLLRGRLEDDARRQMLIDARAEVQREQSGNRVFEEIVERKFRELERRS